MSRQNKRQLGVNVCRREENQCGSVRQSRPTGSAAAALLGQCAIVLFGITVLSLSPSLTRAFMLNITLKNAKLCWAVMRRAMRSAGVLSSFLSMKVSATSRVRENWLVCGEH